MNTGDDDDNAKTPAGRTMENFHKMQDMVTGFGAKYVKFSMSRRQNSRT